MGRGAGCVRYAFDFAAWQSQDIDLNRVAGNTISVPVVGAIGSVMLASTRWRKHKVLPMPKSMKQLTDLPPPQWIGDQRVSKHGSSWDTVAPQTRKRSGSAKDARGASKKAKPVQQKLDKYVSAAKQ